MDEYQKQLVTEWPDRDRLTDYLTGYLLTELGHGVRIRDIVSIVVLRTLEWKHAMDAFKKEKVNNV